MFTQLNVKTVQFQTIQLSVSTVLMSKTVLIQLIQFSIKNNQFRLSTQFTSIWHIDRTLIGATTPGQSEPGNDDSEGVLRIAQSSSITGTSE